MAKRKRKSDFYKDVHDVKTCLEVAAPHGLVVEVIVAALNHIKDNPNASIEEALAIGLDLWDV